MADSEETAAGGDEMIVTVTGTIGAGETVLCDIFQEKGFKKVSLSDILREKLREMGKPVIRDNLRELGDSLRKKNGPAALAELAWEKVKSGGNWVVDSVMSKGEMDFLKEKGAYSIGITAPDKVRYKRVIGRDKGSQKKFPSFEEFISIDNHDRTIGVDEILENADIIINNDGTIENLKEIVDMVIETISSSRAQN